jgi:ADP-ribose pyrophosphatase
MEERGPWKVESSKCRYKNPFLSLMEDQVIQPDGKPGTYATVEIKPGVSILPIDEDGNAYLIRQFRYALGRDSIEVVSGGLEEGETPLDAAKREVREEMGIQAEEWHDLGQIEEDTSLVRSRGYLFLARRLSFTKPEQDGTEQVEFLKMSFEEAVQRVMQSEIVHSPSALVILKALLTIGWSDEDPEV